MRICSKQIYLLSIFILSLRGYSQNIFDYEQKINQAESYIFHEIDFKNTCDNIKLSGTLITPSYNYDKIVIIVPGSGRDTRYAHFVLAEGFLKKGIAVYRFDERGIGKSEGQFNTTATSLMDDLSFAILELKRIDFIK